MGQGRGALGSRRARPWAVKGEPPSWLGGGGGGPGGLAAGEGVTRACVTHSDAPAVCRARMVAGWRDMDEEVAQWSVPCRWALPID